MDVRVRRIEMRIRRRRRRRRRNRSRKCSSLKRVAILRNHRGSGHAQKVS
jgi:hypothetical protein